MSGGLGMTDFIEYEGKSVDKALEKASKELDLPLDQLSYDVISYGSTGIFGLVGVKKAKIRVKTNHSKGSFHREAKQKAKDLVKSAFGIEEKAEEPEVVSSVELDCGKQALHRIVDAISEGATITAEHKNHRIIFKIEGGNSGLLIGKRGQTLEAIQYLI